MENAYEEVKGACYGRFYMTGWQAVHLQVDLIARGEVLNYADVSYQR